MRTDHVHTVPQHDQQVDIMSLLFSWLFADFLIIFALITILGSPYRPWKQYPNIITTIPIFFWFYYYFSCENAKVSIFGIFYLNSGHWILVPFRWPDSGDHSSVNTRITQFRGRSDKEWPESNRNRGGTDKTSINQGHREGLYHWQRCEQVPLTFTSEEATQESSRNVKSNMSTISFPNMDASKIYLWAK